MKRIITSFVLILSFISLSGAQVDSLNILLFGHSFGVDCTQYMPLLMESAGVKTVRIARFKKSNCSLKERYKYFKTDNAEGYTECEPGTTEWVERPCTFKEAIAARDWDYVVFQNSLENEGIYEDKITQPYLNEMVVYVRTVQKEKFGKEPTICWNMFWPMSKLLESTENRGLARRMEPYGYNSENMWKAYVSATKAMSEDTGIDHIIPSGTAVMNARASYLNTSEMREFTKDGYHMSSGAGRYLAACSWFEYFIKPAFGVSVMGNSLRLPDMPSPVTDENAEFLQRCAVEAVANPYVVKKWTAELSDNEPNTLTRLVREVRHLKVSEEYINIGIDKPFKILHMSDVHIAKADRRDSSYIQDLPGKRAKLWSEYYLEEARDYSEAHSLPIVVSGDFIDFVSEANLDIAAANFQMNRMLVCPGNHEFARMRPNAKEDDAYKAASFDKVQAAYPVPLDHYSRIINGVNFVLLDDSYYKITKAQWEFVKFEIKKGLPVILVVHIPFYTPEQCEYALKQSKGKSANLLGAPAEVTDLYSDKRKEQQQTDKLSQDFINWLKKQQMLKGILCGHCHYSFKSQFSPTAIQYTVGALFNGEANEIEIR